MDLPFALMLGGVLGFVIILFGAILFIDDTTATDLWIMLGCILFVGIVLLWLAFDITYEFREDHLFIRAGFLFTRIRYEDIEGYNILTNKMDIFSGFNLLSSTKAMEILAPTVMLGCVKISPSDLEGFIEQLEIRMKKELVFKEKNEM